VGAGTVANLEQEVSAALPTPPGSADDCRPGPAVKPRRRDQLEVAGRLCWLWTAATTQVVAFLIHASGCAG